MVTGIREVGRIVPAPVGRREFPAPRAAKLYGGGKSPRKSARAFSIPSKPVRA
jgi:hypothetical protein